MTITVRGLLATTIVLSAVGWAFASEAAAQQATVQCKVTANGAWAKGSVVLMRGEKKVASKACETDIRVAPGEYNAVVRLEGALDRPSETQTITVTADEKKIVKGDFATGTLTVTVKAKGGGSAKVTVKRGGKSVGTAKSGKAFQLSTGVYDISVKHRGEEVRFEKVEVNAGERRTLNAQF